MLRLIIFYILIAFIILGQCDKWSPCPVSDSTCPCNSEGSSSILDKIIGAIIQELIKQLLVFLVAMQGRGRRYTNERATQTQPDVPGLRPRSRNRS